MIDAERTCGLCNQQIKAGQPRLMRGPDHYQTFVHEACSSERARRQGMRCSAAGCIEPDKHARGCPAAGDCPHCECCTAAICRDRTWRDPGTPQNIVAAVDTWGMTCPCERRG